MSKTFHHGKRAPRWSFNMGRWPTPNWWTRYHMNRPRRRENRHLLRQVRKGYRDADDTAFCLGSRKPHRYFW